MNARAPERVPVLCRRCQGETAMLPTASEDVRLCDTCWELEFSIPRKPKIALEIMVEAGFDPLARARSLLEYWESFGPRSLEAQSAAQLRTALDSDSPTIDEYPNPRPRAFVDGDPTPELVAARDGFLRRGRVPGENVDLARSAWECGWDAAALSEQSTWRYTHPTEFARRATEPEGGKP